MWINFHTYLPGKYIHGKYSYHKLKTSLNLNQMSFTGPDKSGPFTGPTSLFFSVELLF